MFCPNCKCEYLQGVKECADCGVALVEAPDLPNTALPEDRGLVSIWAGDDPGECAAVKEALENASVPFTDLTQRAYFIFPSLRQKMEIWVSNADVDRAETALLDLGGRVNPTELTPDEIESLALPESDAVDQDQDVPAADDIPADWDGEAPLSEVWTGEQEDFANTLVACLREIGIPSRKLSEATRWRILVRSEQGKRAREIVREVVEASPPK